MTEEWLPVLDYEFFYEVSNQGRVRAYWGEEIPQNTNARGYKCVTLRKRGVSKSCRVHQLVLTAFLRPREPWEECRHLNGDQTDNRLGNLCWGSHGENALDQVRHGTHNMASKTHCPRGHSYAEHGTSRRRANGHNQRTCVPCKRERDRASRSRRRVA